MSMIYSDPTRETEPAALPNVETFYQEGFHCDNCDTDAFDGDECMCDEAPEEGESSTISGWYWQAGFPGCLPDGEPTGPFETEAEAIADAQDSE
jgi:hypothetical protein